MAERDETMAERDETMAEREDPWIETRRGGLFFVNALFIFPWIILAIPLLTRVVVRGLGGMQERIRIVDTFPELAEYLMPVYGWLTLLPIWLLVRNLRVEPAALPRAALVFFLLLHAAALLWTASGWIGLHEWTLPGAPPGGG
ncbi:MAG: hypothetical protein EA352_11275 [Gemmatimonadales bacterium]|nr:MAG: hypothetical protein EA352_11275 [Gemmatimonadales bacterium]